MGTVMVRRPRTPKQEAVKLGAVKLRRLRHPKQGNVSATLRKGKGKAKEKGRGEGKGTLEHGDSHGRAPAHP